ncbi:hypothetical protein I862_06920 [endosymbiont of Acanthamoeba sp. UWC8]|uniref:hypothetical protein n=1 Tax=endosymbiont of Acanthamoeba sp. UWC8 TaxID=86106 RepID=UPI0004D0C16D|nr:hypothetical protein [endosymbiont of Acanthamoeba sp. UWC8]AIF81938.1 hypothetical protein I862_06920 [endosymbiont of Acanthamoeba sp. UWC8]
MKYFNKDNWNEIVALGSDELQLRLKEQLNQYSGFILQDTSFTESQLKILFEVLKENKTITSLDLSDNDLKDAEVIAIAEVLKENKTITSLNLSGNYIEEAGVIAIAEALKGNKTITSLDLGYNRIREAGWIAIAETLRKNKTLTLLNLGYNNIREAGWIAIAEALKENKIITSLDLSDDYITDKGAIELIKLLESNKSILEINLRKRTISPDKFEEVNDLILKNRVIFCNEIERLYNQIIDQSNFRSFMQLQPKIKVILNKESLLSNFTTEEQEKMKSLMHQATRYMCYKQDNFFTLAGICKKIQLDDNESFSLLHKLPHELIYHINSYLSFKDIKSSDRILQEGVTSQTVETPQGIMPRLLGATSHVNKSTLER